MASSDAGKYTYNRTLLKFRNKASIKLPKSGDFATLARDKCYKIAIDVIIESVTKPEYRNFQTTPYHGFYGYATLVMRDCIAPKIQLQFGRNRIFEQRIVEAFQGWNELAFYLQTTKKFLELLANTLRSGESPSITNICDLNEAFSISWSEIDLREVYVLCPENTQFKIELSWVSPEKFTDDCGQEQEGDSKEPDDPHKDSGLPENGTQPKKNDASDPFGGNTPFSPLSADSPYFNPKGDNLNDSNPDNSAPVVPERVGLQLTWMQSCRPSGQSSEVTRFFGGDILVSDLIIFTNAGLPRCSQDTALIATNNRTGAVYGTDGSGVIYSVGGQPAAIFNIPLPDSRIP